MDALVFPVSQAFQLLAATLVLYLACVAIHRLYFSPIATFPGPKLAALTFWYELYYDVLRKGRYTWRIQGMHRKYGPIVRINPFELHVNDPSFYDEVYVGATRRTEKWSWSAKMFGTSEAAVGTTSHELHQVRRKALNPFFSKRSVTRLEPVVHANVDCLSRRLREFAGSGKPVNVSDAFTCLSADVIGSYAFGRSYEFLNTSDFYPGWRKLMMELSRSTHLMKQFGWGYTLLKLIPEWIVSLVHPLTRQLFQLQHDISNQVLSIKQEKAHDSPSKIPEQTTIFHDLLDSKLPDRELTVDRLTEEAITVIGAGTVTTAQTLAITLYHVLGNPSILQRIRADVGSLAHRCPGPPSWQDFESLPYLSAIISEGLRLAYGVSHRLQRISPDLPLKFGGWVIPAGTPVSMTNMFIHEDANIFEDPREFRPERWLSSSFESPNNVSELRKFFVPFSRGTRQCVGINLAYAELYLTLGTLLGPKEHGGVEMELFETDQSDIDVVHDFFNPSPKLDSKGIQILVQ